MKLLRTWSSFKFTNSNMKDVIFPVLVKHFATCKVELTNTPRMTESVVYWNSKIKNNTSLALTLTVFES